jgi:hypothetical protein
MILSDRTLTILKNFTAINNSIHVKAGNELSTVNQGKSLLVKATVAENFEKEFAIYDLNRFLSTHSLFNNKPEIVLNSNHMILKDDNKTVKYVYCEPEFILTPPDKDLGISKTDYIFSITAVDLQQIMKATAVMKFPNIEFRGSEGVLSVRAFDVENPTSDGFSITFGKSFKEFNAVFQTDLFKMLPDNYVIMIDKGIAQFSSSDMIYWMAVLRKESNFT